MDARLGSGRMHILMHVCICKGEFVRQPVIRARFDISYHIVQYSREEGREGREVKREKVPQVCCKGVIGSRLAVV